MPIGPTLLRLQRTLHLSQRELGELLGVSSRTIIRYYQGDTALSPATYEMLARKCHPVDRAFASELAAAAGQTLGSLGLETEFTAQEAPRPAPTARYMADSVLCAAAEAMQASPHAMRPALAAALERIVALGMTAEDALRAMAPPKATRSK